MKLKDVLEDFRQFILLNFESMNELLSDDLVADWLQANWEVIVESRLQEEAIVTGLIDVYGEGADCNDSSSRCSLPKSQPECAVHVKQDFVLHSFGTLQNGFFVQLPPFNYVKGENSKSETVLKFSEAQFTIGKPYDSIAI